MCEDLRGEAAGGVQLQGRGFLPVVHGPADERDGGEPDRAGAAAAERAAPVGVDVPFRGAGGWPRTARCSATSRASSWRRCTRSTPSVRLGRAPGAKTGAVTPVQRTSSDLRLNPHLAPGRSRWRWHEQGGELSWQGLGHLQTSEVGAVLESTVRRIDRHLRGAVCSGSTRTAPIRPSLAIPRVTRRSAVSGQTPPAGPQWVSGLHSLEPHPLAYDKPLCASLDGFTLHAATRAGRFTRGARGAAALRPAPADRPGAPRAAP